MDGWIFRPTFSSVGSGDAWQKSCSSQRPVHFTCQNLVALLDDFNIFQLHILIKYFNCMFFFLGFFRRPSYFDQTCSTWSSASLPVPWDSCSANVLTPGFSGGEKQFGEPNGPSVPLVDTEPW